MPEIMSTTGTTDDVPVQPDTRVRYKPIPPAGRPHTVYKARLAEPSPRPHD